MDHFAINRIRCRLLLLIFSLLGITTIYAQQTNNGIEPYQLNLRSLWKKSKDSLNVPPLNSGVSQNDSNQVNQTSKPELIFEGYVDTYYALSTDSNSYIPNSIDLFQSVGPRNNQFGLNVARIKTSFSSEKVRGTISMFWGDIPRYSWSTEAPYNNIQEANVGIRLAKKWWLDAGFFTTHVGGELLLPKDNFMSTISIGTYHEPFFMGGVILTYDICTKLTAKLIFANDYYYFSDPNALGDKAFGSLITYRPSKALTLTYNNFLLNRTPAFSKENAYRFYNNLNALYSKKNLQVLASLDFGFENNVHLDTSSVIRNAFFSSGELAIKYRFSPFWAVYSRIDYFDDRNGAISNLDRTYKNKYGKIQGLSCYSFTFGGEINPTAGSYLRFEARVINADSKLLWFKNLDGKMSYQRSEILITIGVNFTSGNLIK